MPMPPHLLSQIRVQDMAMCCSISVFYLVILLMSENRQSYAMVHCKVIEAATPPYALQRSEIIVVPGRKEYLKISISELLE